MARDKIPGLTEAQKAAIRAQVKASAEQARLLQEQMLKEQQRRLREAEAQRKKHND